MSKLEAINGGYQRDAREVLEDALAMDFETVIVFGFKDGAVATKMSMVVSNQRLIGALEEAKWFVMTNQQDA